jgi:hypothetical protein
LVAFFSSRFQLLYDHRQEKNPAAGAFVSGIFRQSAAGEEKAQFSGWSKERGCGQLPSPSFGRGDGRHLVF